MKYNLKNRPQLVSSENGWTYWAVNVHDPEAVTDLLYELEDWFAGFEAELRQLLQTYPNKSIEDVINENLSNYGDVAYAAFDLGMRAMILKILGEVEKWNLKKNC